jgi:hypothetical protein
LLDLGDQIGTGMSSVARRRSLDKLFHTTLTFAFKFDPLSLAGLWLATLLLAFVNVAAAKNPDGCWMEQLFWKS